MARPPKPIDARQVERLAAIGCTCEEIGDVLGIDHRNIERRFAPSLEKGRGRLHKSLKRKQVALALKGNPTMLIWLGKQYLRQRDLIVSDVTSAGHRIGGPDLTNLTDVTKALVLKELGGPVEKGAPDGQ